GIERDGHAGTPGGRGRDDVTGLDEASAGEVVAREGDEADRDTAERDAEQGTFELRVATERVDGGQRDRGRHARYESAQDDASMVAVAGAHALSSCSPRRVPTQRMNTTSRPRPRAQPTAPSAIGPIRPMGAPPRSSGSRRYSTYRA